MATDTLTGKQKPLFYPTSALASYPGSLGTRLTSAHVHHGIRIVVDHRILLEAALLFLLGKMELSSGIVALLYLVS